MADLKVNEGRSKDRTVRGNVLREGHHLLVVVGAV